MFDLQSRHGGLETDLCPSTNKQLEEYLGESVPTRSDLLCQFVFSLYPRTPCGLTMSRTPASASSVGCVGCCRAIRSDEFVNADVGREAYVSPAVLRQSHDKKAVTKILC